MPKKSQSEAVKPKDGAKSSPPYSLGTQSAGAESSAQDEGQNMSRQTDEDDRVDMREFILRVAEEAKREADHILRGSKVLFYPACGLNWQTIQEYSSQCDLFVYCDWNIKKEDFDQAIETWPVPDCTAERLFVGNDMCESFVDKIGCMNHLPWLLAQPLRENVNPWGDLVKLTISISGNEKDLGLLYLAGNPIEAYRVLFTEENRAPTFIYLRQPIGVPTKAWHFLSGPDGPIANVVASNPHRPGNLIIDNSPRHIGLWLGQH